MWKSALLVDDVRWNVGVAMNEEDGVEDGFAVHVHTRDGSQFPVDADLIGSDLFAGHSVELDAASGASIECTFLNGTNDVRLVKARSVRLIEPCHAADFQRSLGAVVSNIGVSV